jgi:hypothetical protein
MLRVVGEPHAQISAASVVGIEGSYQGCAGQTNGSSWVLDTAGNAGFMEGLTGLIAPSVEMNDTCALQIDSINTSSTGYTSTDLPTALVFTGSGAAAGAYLGSPVGFDDPNQDAANALSFYANAQSTVVDSSNTFVLTVVVGDDANVGTSTTIAELCTGDLSDIGSGDFEVSFTLQTTQPDGEFALLNQRSVCGPGNFWDVRVQSGHIIFETDSLTDAAPDDDGFIGCTSVTDGQPHTIVIQRIAGLLSLYVDGTLDTSGPSTSSFGPLPPLATGSDVCVGSDATVAFNGSDGALTNACVAPGSPTPLGGATSACN